MPSLEYKNVGSPFAAPAPDIIHILPFHSIDDLLSKIKTTDYQEIMDKAEANQQKQREEIFFSYEQVFREWC